MGICIVNKLLELLPKSCKKLCDVTFKAIIYLDFTSIQAYDRFFEGLKDNLKRVRIDNFINSDISPNPIGAELLKNLFLCHKLEVLELRYGTKITNNMLKMISKMPNLKRLILKKVGPQATNLGQFFREMKLDKLEYLYLEGSQFLTDEAVQNLAIRMPTNLKDIWFYKCPNLKLQKSTLKSLKICPKLKNVGFEWSALHGISANFLREFNDQKNLFVSHKRGFGDIWIELEKKLIIDYHLEVIDHHGGKISKIIEEYGYEIFE